MTIQLIKHIPSKQKTKTSTQIKLVVRFLSKVPSMLARGTSVHCKHVDLSVNKLSAEYLRSFLLYTHSCVASSYLIVLS